MTTIPATKDQIAEGLALLARKEVEFGSAAHSPPIPLDEGFHCAQCSRKVLRCMMVHGRWARLAREGLCGECSRRSHPSSRCGRKKLVVSAEDMDILRQWLALRERMGNAAAARELGTRDRLMFSLAERAGVDVPALRARRRAQQYWWQDA